MPTLCIDDSPWIDQAALDLLGDHGIDTTNIKQLTAVCDAARYAIRLLCEQELHKHLVYLSEYGQGESYYATCPGLEALIKKVWVRQE